MTPRFLACCVSVALGFLFVSPRSEAPLCGDEPARPAAALEAGFGEADITPEVDKKPVYIAGFGKNRKADGVHDPLIPMARAQRARDILVELGWRVEWHEYSMPHSVCMEEVVDVATWLTKVCPKEVDP